jgi:puromycin-sensitive aminopeptidase
VPDQATVQAAPSDERAYRLPRTVVPERYELTLTPDLRAFTFAGEERVAVRVHEPVREILLNALELEIREAYLTNAAGARLDGSVTLEEADERARVALSGTAELGEWSLHLRFSGILNDKLHGFYRSVYRDADGAEQVIATTQFEATDARRAFPCWDEPDFKAVFAVTLVVDEGLTAISNTAATGETRLDGGKKAVTFADSMKMSTYLVAFIVGKLEATDPVMVDGTPLRVICVPGKRHLADYALEVGAFCLRFFADYYRIPYPGDKLDLIALPDFASGAMENLGAVTFRERLLLVDPATAARSDLQVVADVVAHELAHMWFGDLVTMRWWNGIWLNEAFATFMEMLAVDAFKPEWERWISFALGRGAALLTDGLKSTRPIEFPVGRPDECESMFDILTYQKGAAVLRMLEQYLGGPEFQRGIALYLRSHQYANAETTDLWDAIEEATGEPARRIMDSWIFQGGYPVVSVEAAPDGKRLTLSQRRFLYADGGDSDVRWQVPVMLRLGTADGVATRKILLGEETTTVDLPDRADWVVANESGHGFYRVRYAPDLLRKLTANVQQNLAPIERFGLVNDAWASVLAGLTPVGEFLDLARLFGEETDRNVWLGLIGGLGYVNRMLEPDRRPALHAFVRELIGPAVERLGWTPREGESELTGQLRGTLIGALGTLGEDPATRAKASELHEAYLADRSAVAPDVVPAVISIVADSGGPAEYDLFIQRYKAAPTPQEEQRYLFALAGFQDRGLVQRTLDLTLTDEVRTQNAPFLIGSSLHNLVGGDLAWAFVKAHWDEIVARFPDNTHVRMLEGITALSTPDLAPDVEQFFTTHTVKQGAKTLEQHLERLRINVAFRQREAGNLATYFG